MTIQFRFVPAVALLLTVCALSPDAPATQPVNLSTRVFVQTADNIGIGGFIITGTAPKHVIVRALGPSLTAGGVVNALSDPVLEIRGPGSFTPIRNNNWRDTQQAQIIADGIPPSDDRESAIDAILNPGAYTALVSGAGGAAGVALVEVYDLDPAAASQLANISTRGFIASGDSIMIGGLIILPPSVTDTEQTRLVIRGIGPSLGAAGVPNALRDPQLEVRDSEGALLIANDEWQSDSLQAVELVSAGVAPTDPKEAAVAVRLRSGNYTVLLRGMGSATGNGLIEIYNLGYGTVTEHLYIASDKAAGVVAQWDLPITQASGPNVYTALAADYPTTVTINGSADLAYGDSQGMVKFYTAPLRNPGTPTATFRNSTLFNNGQIAFDNNGDLFAANTGDRVNRYTHPFSNSSTPSLAITNPALTDAWGIAFDSSQNLYVTNVVLGAGGGTRVLVFTPPYTGTPVVTGLINIFDMKMAIHGSQLFTVGSGVNVFDLPITPTSTPAFRITNGLSGPAAAAFDSAGNLYVSNLVNATITVYAPPFSVTSTPISTMPIRLPSASPFGIAIGR